MSSFSPPRPIRVAALPSPAAPRRDASRSVQITVQGDGELFALLTQHIARGRPLEALTLIDRLLVADGVFRDPALAADLRVLRNVANLELARQHGPRGRTGSESHGGVVDTILDFAERILPALRQLELASRQSILIHSTDDQLHRRSSCRSAHTSVPDLSDREREVLCQVAIGLSNQKIARALFISESTVKKHLTNVYAKLGVENRTEAVAIARRRGMLE